MSTREQAQIILDNMSEIQLTADWLLVYQLFSDVLVLSLTRTGSHSDFLGCEFIYPSQPYRNATTSALKHLLA